MLNQLSVSRSHFLWLLQAAFVLAILASIFGCDGRSQPAEEQGGSPSNSGTDAKASQSSPSSNDAPQVAGVKGKALLPKLPPDLPPIPSTIKDTIKVVKLRKLVSAAIDGQKLDCDWPASVEVTPSAERAGWDVAVTYLARYEYTATWLTPLVAAADSNGPTVRFFVSHEAEAKRWLAHRDNDPVRLQSRVARTHISEGNWSSDFMLRSRSAILLVLDMGQTKRPPLPGVPSDQRAGAEPQSLPNIRSVFPELDKERASASRWMSLADSCVGHIFTANIAVHSGVATLLSDASGPVWQIDTVLVSNCVSGQYSNTNFTGLGSPLRNPFGGLLDAPIGRVRNDSYKTVQNPVRGFGSALVSIKDPKTQLENPKDRRVAGGRVTIRVADPAAAWAMSFGRTGDYESSPLAVKFRVNGVTSSYTELNDATRPRAETAENSALRIVLDVTDAVVVIP